MSDSEYPIDVKEPVQSGLPVHRINDDAETLTLGGRRRRWFWKRFCCHKKSAMEGQEKKKRCLGRFAKFVIVSIVLLGAAGFFMQGYKMNCMVKHHPVTCVPLEGAHHSIQLPLLQHSTHINLHKSLNGGDTHIVHSDDVKEGTAVISFDLPEGVKLTDDDETPELFVCDITGPKFVGVGIHSKHNHKHAKGIKAKTTTITLSSAEAGHSRSISLMGPHPKFHHGHRFALHKFRKAIKKEIKKAITLASWAKVEHDDAEVPIPS